MLVSFSIGRAVIEDIAIRRFEDVSKDERLGALRIDASLHRSTLIIYDNGRGVVIGQSSRRIAEMAVRHWVAQLDGEGALAGENAGKWHLDRANNGSTYPFRSEQQVP